ncbi:uncharacterized protein LOC131004174 [Salvia miltiorrhiza]|uniref:uncharacterized protein LOC131004174 n=1 Tax=Salvia miltiorrhiza TaxID=226208 RepID=UPI0025AC4A04|nr:uncharacterized protein LOC131004174 [Salvia miltiorrhiza]
MSSDEHLTKNNDSDNDPDNPIQEGGWKWKRPLMRGVSCTIVTYTKDSTIMNGIRRVLTDIGGEVALKQFEKSCFGRFLKLPDSINKCNQAIHHVISHQIIFGEEADKTALWFRINNQNLRFSRFEYALVTGLQFGESAFNPYVEHEIHEHSLYHRELDGRPTTPTELLKKFLEGHLGDYAEDYVKAAKILFAYYIVLGDDGRRAIKDWVWALIEDREAWNSFPWGSYSFQRLIFYIDGVQQTPTKDCVREQYHLYGAASSFMAWIYCAIPELGKNCGGIASKSRIPRMLRFLYSRTVIDVDSITGTVYPILEPTNEEKNKKSWKSVESEGTPFKLKYMECRGMPKKSKNEVISKKPMGDKSNAREVRENVGVSAGHGTDGDGLV